MQKLDLAKQSNSVANSACISPQQKTCKQAALATVTQNELEESIK